MAIEEILPFIDAAKLNQNNVPSPIPDCSCYECRSADFRKISYLQAWEIEDAAREYSGLVD